MAADVVRLICPNLNCRAILSVPNTARGKDIRCRQCQTRIRVPTRRANNKRTGSNNAQGNFNPSHT